MKDFIQVIGYVEGGEYIRVNKKNGKIKHYFFDYFSKPLNLCGTCIKMTEFAETAEKKLKKEIEKNFYKNFDKCFNNKKYYYIQPKLDIKYSVKIASEQNANWCLHNLTYKQLKEMGVSIY